MILRSVEIFFFNKKLYALNLSTLALIGRVGAYNKLVINMQLYDTEIEDMAVKDNYDIERGYVILKSVTSTIFSK